MRRLIVLAILVVAVFCASNALATTYYTYINGGSSGFWGDASTWTTDPSGISLVGSAVPANGDVVHILNGYTVILNANVSTTDLVINIQNGGTLDLRTHTIATIATLSGSGLLRINAGYFPTITNNSFRLGAASGATVEYYDFTGVLPPSIEYPNILFTNSTTNNYTMTFSNSVSYDLEINGTFITQATGTGTLGVVLGSQAGNAMDVNFDGNITIGAGTTFGVGAFNSAHNLTVSGNFTNNGTVDFSNTAQYAATPDQGLATLTFIGATNRALACNGTTDLYNLIVNKGSGSTNILSVTSTNVNNLRFFSAVEVFTITNGTLRLGANISVPRIRGTGNYNVGDVGTSPMLWVDGADVNFQTIALVVYGKFRITSGSFSSLGGQGTVIRLEGQYLIEGGTFTTEKFRPSTEAGTHRGSFIMSGGTFNAQGSGGSNVAYARFSHPYPEQVFIMSGGTINVSNPQSTLNGGIHIGSNSSNYSVTGGTFNAILSTGATTFRILSTAPFWNLNIQRTGGTGIAQLNSIGSVSGTLTTIQPLVVLNNFTIDATNTPTFDSNGESVTIGRDFTIGTGASYLPNGNTTTFNGSTDQNFINNGNITPSMFNLTVNKPSGALILGGTAPTYTVSNTLDIARGILNDGGKTVAVAGTVNNDAIHTGTGSITLNGASTQTITGDGDGVFGNLTLSNNSVPGVTLDTDIAISATLTLAGTGNSLFDIGHYQLSLTSSSATAIAVTGDPFASDKMIRTSGFQSDRGVSKTFGNLTAFTFPVGVGTSYTPATIQLTSAPTTYGTITVRPVDSRHQFVTAGNVDNLSFYWKVVSSGFTGLAATAVSHTYQYVDANVSPLVTSDQTYVPARYNPTSWTVISDLTQVNDATNRILFTGVGYIDGEFTAGVPAAFGAVKIFYTIRSGNWTDVGAGTTPWSNVSHVGAEATTFPVVGDHVYIGDGGANDHTITITSNAQASGGLEISAGSVLDVGTTTGHNFGTFENTQIAGSGLLRISSATGTAEFPAGDFGNFIRDSGGTVEYYTTGGQNFTIPLISAAPTNLPLDSYRNLVLTPAAGDFIQMPDEDLVIYNDMTVQGANAVRLNASSARTLSIEGDLAVTTGRLQFRNDNAQTVEVAGDVSIGASGRFVVAAIGATAPNVLILSGNLVNDGIFDMFNTATLYADVTFTGAGNHSITGTGSRTDFNTLTVSKGTSQASVLNVNANNFTLLGAVQPLILSNGTFRLSSTQSVTIADGVDFDIPATARLSVNGGTISTTGVNETDLLLAGTLEVLSGTMNVGTTANDNAIVYAATGEPTIAVSGGTLNVTGQIRRSFASSQGALIYNQSGSSTVSVAISSALTTTRGVFEILNTGSSFTKSGGVLRINRSSNSSAIADVYLQPSTSLVTGGTVEVGTAATSNTFDINSIIAVYNVSVTGTTNIARLEFNGLTIRGTLDIAASNVFNASGFNVSIAGNLVNSNTSNTTGTTVGGYRPGSASQTTTFNSTNNNQFITGVTGNLTNFANLVINNTFASGTVQLQPDTELRVNGTLTLTSGTLAVVANTITAIGTVNNSARHTSTTGRLLLQGSSGQSIGGNGTGRFGNLELDNGSGAVFAASQEVTGTLTLTDGSLFIGSHGLNLSNTSLSAISNASASRYIITSGNLSDAGVTKAFAASVTGGNFVYPIGVSGKYTPADYTITTGVLGGTITIRPVNSKHPSATGSGTAFIDYYWSVSHSVIILNDLIHTYQYAAADESGDPNDYRDARFRGGAWTIGIDANNPDILTRVITFTNTDLAGDYTAGEPTAFVNPTTYTSIASGDWESDVSVWTPDPPGSSIGPPDGSFVIIDVGHTVTVTSNSQRMATLEVRGRLHLGNTISHDFGTVTVAGAGDRTIQLQSSTFPSGDFSAFTAAGGGTVEYNGTVILPTRNTYNNITFTGTGTKTLPNADLTVNGAFTVFQGNVTNAVNNRSIVLVDPAGDLTNNGQFTMGSGIVIVGRHLINSGAGAVFNAGNGTLGLLVGGNLVNNTSAVFNGGSDDITVTGNINNASTFNAGAGLISAGNINNTAGSFTGNAGAITVTGSVTNNSVFTAGAGTVTIGGSYLNSGASAVHTANANVMSITGNFSNSVSAIFHANTGSLSVGGNWTNSSTFNAGTGSVAFNGAGAQVLNGTTTFNNVSRTNGGSLTLNNSVNVGGLLTMTSGNIITGSNTLSLTNTTTQPVPVYGTGSFVDGRLSISYPNTASTSRVYPIGRGSIYRPVTIQQTGVSTNPVVRVEMINTPPTGTFPNPIEGLSEARHYSIDLLSGTMDSPTIELSFNTNAPTDENIVVPGNVRIVRSTSASGPWTDEGGAGVFSPAAPAGYAISGVTSIANPTFFALGYQNPALPVTLQAFTGGLKDNVVELSWTTLTEINNDYFTIERSGSDELQFDSIGYIAGAGNSKTVLQYRELDPSPLPGTSYYRLKQTDFDGKFSYSEIVRIDNHNEPFISIYPNPAGVTQRVFVKLHHEVSKRMLIVITNVAGKVLYERVVENSDEFDVNHFSEGQSLSPGIYFVNVRSEGAMVAMKLVVR